MKPYWLTLILIGLVSVSAHADDTEIYLGNPNSQSVKPNIVFIFDTSSSMKTTVASSGGQSRLQVTQAAAIDTINGLSGVNLALMQFNTKDTSKHRGGFLDRKSTRLNSSHVR